MSDETIPVELTLSEMAMLIKATKGEDVGQDERTKVAVWKLRLAAEDLYHHRRDKQIAKAMKQAG